MTGTPVLESDSSPPFNAGSSVPPAPAADKVYRTLQSLRRSFIRIGAVVVATAVGGYFLADPILKYL